MQSGSSSLSRLVGDHDLVVSLLPAPFHPQVMEEALKLGKHCVTSSYVSPAMEVRFGAGSACTALPHASACATPRPQPARVVLAGCLARYNNDRRGGTPATLIPRPRRDAVLSAAIAAAAA